MMDIDHMQRNSAQVEASGMSLKLNKNQQGAPASGLGSLHP